MRNHRITDADAARLVSGRTPQGRPELDSLARSLSEFRAASYGPAPRPSAALAARLSLGGAAAISDSRESAFDAETIETTSPTTRSRSGRKRTVFGWIAGLSLGLKIVLGAALTAAAATGAGAAGVLPFGTQQTFDEVVSVVLPTTEPVDHSLDPGTDEGTDDNAVTDDDAVADDDAATDDSGDGTVTEGYDPTEGNFGSWVSKQAKDKPDSGKNFGELVSDEAKNKPHPGASDESQGTEGDSDESDDDAVSHGNGSHGDHAPAPGKKAH